MTAWPRPSVRVLTRISLRSVSPFRDRVRGVQQQVQEHLPEARFVGLDHRRVAVVLHQAGAVPDLVPGDVDRRIQHAAQRRPARSDPRRRARTRADRARCCARARRPGAPRPAPRPPRRARARARRDRLLSRSTRERERRDLLPDEVDVGDDVRERVVDLVGDAGGQRPDRRHPAREDQLILHPPALRQVADEEVVALGAGTAAVQVDDRHHRQRHVERRAVLARPVNLALDLLGRGLQVGAHQRPVGAETVVSQLRPTISPPRSRSGARTRGSRR